MGRLLTLSVVGGELEHNNLGLVSGAADAFPGLMDGGCLILTGGKVPATKPAGHNVVGDIVTHHEDLWM